MRAWLLLGALHLAASALAAGPGEIDGVAANATAVAQRSAAGDRIVARTYLPSAQRVHGELRLARRGEALCMQTLLYSHSLRRGVDRIRKKELYHWPEGRPGTGDSRRYLAALEQAKRHVLERFAHGEALDDPRPRLLIEFVLGEAGAEVAFYDVEVTAAKEGFVLTDRRPILTIAASPEYVARAIRIQAEEGFDGPLPELERLPG
jgi:hypothetical protein